MTGYKTATVALAAVAALATAGCSSNTTNTDAGVDAPADAGGGAVDAPTDLGPQNCDPYAQNCPVGQKCDFGCMGSSAVVACYASGDGGTIGSACSTTTMPCGRGFGCVVMAGSTAMCRKYCATDTDCASNERCHNVTVGVTCSGPATSFALHYCY